MDHSSCLTVLGALACGAVSGTVASLITFPADVVRRRMQVRGAGAGALSHCEGTSANTPVLKGSTIADEFKAILQADGVRGLYRGIAPELVKVWLLLIG